MCRRRCSKAVFLVLCLPKQHADPEISRDRYRSDCPKVTMIAPTMPLLTIHHKTEYRYTHPVAFGEHRIMLRPRDGHDLRVLSAASRSCRQPMSLRWIHDVFGNSVAIATFDERAETLSFFSTATVEHNPAEEFALTAGRSRLISIRSCTTARNSRPRAVHHAAIRRSRWRAVGVGAEFPRCGRADADLQDSERDDARHPRGVHLPQAPRARHPASARYTADAVRHLPRLRAVHDRGAAAARHRRALRVRLSVHPGRPRATAMSAAARPMPGCRSICRAPAGSSSIPPTASSAPATSCGSRWRAIRARPSRCTARISGRPMPSSAWMSASMWFRSDEGARGVTWKSR